MRAVSPGYSGASVQSRVTETYEKTARRVRLHEAEHPILLIIALWILLSMYSMTIIQAFLTTDSSSSNNEIYEENK